MGDIIFFMSYIGFLFEDMLIEWLEANDFKVEETAILDNRYKIDLLISHPDYEGKLGIQCKSDSYRKVKKSIKDNHKAQHNRAIEEGICENVIFLLRGYDFMVSTEYGFPLSQEGFLMKYIDKGFKNKQKKTQKKSTQFGDRQTLEIEYNTQCNTDTPIKPKK